MSSDPPDPAPSWHALGAHDVLRRLQVALHGLSAQEAAARAERHGPNALPRPRSRPAWRRLLAQFDNVLIHVLLLAAVAAALLEHGVDAAVILAVVIVNAVIGFVQEGRAERAMEAIGKMLAPQARVRRDGRWERLEAERLVPGDIVLLKAGDRVPADLRVVETHDLRIDQAALTGESLPAGKTSRTVDAAAALADRHGMAYAGTLVAAGQGVGAVVAIGAATELGRISALLGSVETLTTPLLREIGRFAKALSVVVLLASAAMVLAAWWLHGLDPREGFVAAVALAVAAIPEGLPAIISIALAVGVQKMGRRSAVIRRLPAVETLGAVSTICTDKTGTLTRNELVVTRVGLVAGVLRSDLSAAGGPGLRAMLEVASLCNDAHPGAAGGDPLERALVELADAAGIDVEALRTEQPRRALLPFSSTRKLMASLHGERLCVKGAPERILQHCTRQCGNDGVEPLEPERWHAELQTMAADGLRVLAIAERRGLALADESGVAELEQALEELELLGLVAFEDPPRAEVPAALAACASAGITVKMITGDHAATAAAIARELGIGGDDAVLTGPQLDALDDAALIEAAERTAVFARTAPEHKLRLVEALQARGRVVAMTGDGANDAPALKRADIGVAMGVKGTEAARQAAEMVLADDNFATIVAGIEEGRVVYDNIRKALLFILPTNAAESLVILLAVLAGVTLPITPVQVLWINMATAITLALALAFEPAEHGLMRRPPRSPRRGLLDVYLVWRILWVGAVLTAACFVLYLGEMNDSGDTAVARTMALNMLVAGEAAYLFNSRRWVTAGWTWEALSANPWAWRSVAVLVLLQAALTYWPPLQKVFGTAALGMQEWSWIAGLALGLFVLVELEKAIQRAWSTRRTEARG